jgi:hypothetical protein
MNHLKKLVEHSISFNAQKQHFENLFFITLFLKRFIIFSNMVDHEMTISMYLIFLV